MSLNLKAAFEEDGYVVVQDLISPDLFPKLQAACDRVVALTRSGQWTMRRTVGKQFPPFDADNPDSWGVQHIMHPDLHEPAFAEYYSSKVLTDAACDLLECKEDDLQMGESCWAFWHQILLFVMFQNSSIFSSILWTMTLP